MLATSFVGSLHWRMVMVCLCWFLRGGGHQVFCIHDVYNVFPLVVDYFLSW